MRQQLSSSALNETDIRFVSPLKAFQKRDVPLSVNVLVRCAYEAWRHQMRRTPGKVLLLCSFLKHVTIMRSVRFHQAEEDRPTLQMHTSLLSFQCNNTCQAWWEGSCDGLVWTTDLRRPPHTYRHVCSYGLTR